MYQVGEVTDPGTLALALAVRRKVFVEEQGVDPAVEYDGLDSTCQHVAAWHEGEVVGTGRLLPQGAVFKIGRMAVLSEHRGKGVGGRMLSALLQMAAQRGASKVVLHAQTHAVSFYARHGFRVVGAEFVEAGIKHVGMEADVSTHAGQPHAGEVTK